MNFLNSKINQKIYRRCYKNRQNKNKKSVPFKVEQKRKQNDNFNNLIADEKSGRLLGQVDENEMQIQTLRL